MASAHDSRGGRRARIIPAAAIIEQLRSRPDAPSCEVVRRAYQWLAWAVIGFTFYVSLLPFRLEPLGLGLGWDLFSGAIATWPRRVPRTNFVANVLLFVPMGFGLCGARLAGGARRFSAGAAVMALLSGLAVSLGAEFLQVFAPGRVVSLADIVAQTAGCGVGILAWAACGPELTRWLRDTHAHGVHDRVRRALVAYAALWVFVNLAPFDITLDMDRLARLLREGQIVFVPFASGLALPRLLWDACVTAVSAVPLGVLAVMGAHPHRCRGVVVAGALGLAVLLAVETAQVVIRSHAADVTDVLCGLAGLAGGIWIGARVTEREGADVAVVGFGRRWAWTGLVIWCVLLCAYHWQPFDFGIDEMRIREKLARLSFVPLAGYQTGSDLNALNNLLARFGMAVPFGIFAALTKGGRRRPARVVALAWTAAATIVFGVIELGQFFVPSRIPDPTDVMLGVVASGVGLRLGGWLRRQGSSEAR